MSKTKKKKTANQVANEMLELFSNIDWGFENNMGMVQIFVSAEQLTSWCRSMGFPLPDETPEVD